MHIIMKLKAKLKLIIKKIYYELKRIYYYGKKYRCPCCNNTYRKFINFNYNRPIYNPNIYNDTYKNTICPYCFSLPRHRIICEFFNNNKTIFQNNPKSLIFAAEMCTEKYFKNNNFSYKTADLFQSADYKIDITNINLKDNSFNLIICNHVLEHVNNYENALKELYRILTTDGILILTVPIDKTSDKIIYKKTISNKQRKRIYGQSDHLRTFGTNTKKIIEKYGFYVDEVNGEIYDTKIYPVIGPGKYDYNHIFVCYKK